MNPASKIFTSPLAAPKAVKRKHITQHGTEHIEDNYFWLRAQNWQEVMLAPEALPADIRTHLLAENTYCDDALADTKGLQKTLIAEMRARIREDDEDVPVEDGPYAYFSAYKTGSEHPVYARRAVLSDDGLSKTTEELLDAEALARQCDYFDLGTIAHSPDHRLLAYAVDRQGSEYFEIRIKNLKTGEDLPDLIVSASDEFIWCADSAALVWVWRDENNRPREVRVHKLGAAIQSDTPIYREEDEGFFLSLGQTSDKRFILICSNDHSTSEVHVLDTQSPNATPKLIAPRTRDMEYHVDHAGATFYILSNADGAEDFKVVTAPEATPGREHWQDLIAPKNGVQRLSQRLFQGYHVRLERENALPRIIVRDLKTGTEHDIHFDGDAYDLDLEPLLDFETTRLRFSTSSPAGPEQIYDYDLHTRKRTVRKTQDIPSGHNPDDYSVERIMAKTDDGEQVPVSLVYRKGLKRDGSAPLLLYGYGSYGITIPAAFSTRRLCLLDRGFVYAIAHIRGGSAKGHAWYMAAKGAGKPKTFHDFIAVAQILIDKGYTAEKRIIAMGGSAGGLLVGAAMNMAPELFGGIIAAVPFVDVLNTMSDETLPLTPPEWPEWGNPCEDKTAFANIASYSPYDNVAERTYPPLLATAGLTDPRVTYWEPTKWVAKLREVAPNAGPYFLKTEMHAGHGGATGRFEGLKTVALEYAFALKVAGLS